MVMFLQENGQPRLLFVISVERGGSVEGRWMYVESFAVAIEEHVYLSH